MRGAASTSSGVTSRQGGRGHYTASALAEQQMAQTTNQWLHKSERQALNKAAELSHKETQFILENAVLLQERTKLQTEHDTLVSNLIACQETIYEESKAFQQFRQQLMARPSSAGVAEQWLLHIDDETPDLQEREVRLGL